MKKQSVTLLKGKPEPSVQQVLAMTRVASKDPKQVALEKKISVLGEQMLWTEL